MRNLTLGLMMLATPIWGSPPSEVANSIVDAKLRGTSTYKFLGFPLYHGALWTKSGNPFSINGDFALVLTYKKGFSSSALANATLKELAAIEGVSKPSFASLEPKLETCFRKVNSGDRISAVPIDSDNVRFFYNGLSTCTLTYPNIRTRFFGIWLGDKTRDPIGTNKMLGKL